MVLLSTPPWNIQWHTFLLCFKPLWNTVRTLGNSRGWGADVAFLLKKKRKRWGASPGYSGWEWDMGSWLCLQAPLPSMSQLPVGLFQEFLLTQSQQNIEIRGAINGGNGNDSEFLERPTSDPRQKDSILELSPTAVTLPDETSQRTGNVNAKSRRTLDVFENIYSCLFKVFRNIWTRFDIRTW